ncbi:SCO4848 family membrane protein [Jatrophihabitans sp. DSM 45814]
MLLSKRVSGFLIAFGIWSLWIWPTFLHNIWKDDRSFDHGPTGFFLVHLALTVVSLSLGLIIGWIGVRGWRAASSRQTAQDAVDSATRG